jgi:DNA-directed RNA polymerase specialized sigma24 family protein
MTKSKKTVVTKKKKKVSKKKVSKKKLAPKVKKKVTKKVPKKNSAKKVTKKKVSKKTVTVEIVTPNPPVVLESKQKVAEKNAGTGTTTPTTKRPAKYLNNKDLLAQVIASHSIGKMTNELAKMLMLLVTRYAKKGNFVNYTYNDDMQSYAILSLVKTWRGFDPKKSSNPFAFYTQCIKNAFIQYLNYERKHRDTKDKLLVDSGLNPSFGYAYDLMEEEKNNSEHADQELVVDAPTKFLEDVDPFQELPDTNENTTNEL